MLSLSTLRPYPSLFRPNLLRPKSVLSGTLFVKKGIITPFPQSFANHPQSPTARIGAGNGQYQSSSILRIMQKRMRLPLTCKAAAVHLASKLNHGKHRQLTSRSDNTLAGSCRAPRVSARFCGQPRPRKLITHTLLLAPGCRSRCRVREDVSRTAKLFSQSLCCPMIQNNSPFAQLLEKNYNIGAFSLSSLGKVGVFPQLMPYWALVYYSVQMKCTLCINSKWKGKA